MTTELSASHANVAGRKETLVKDLKGVVVDADELLKAVASSTAEDFAVARTQIERKLGEARSRLTDARIALGRQACDAADATNEYVRENPWKLIGVAAVAGLITAILLSRR